MKRGILAVILLLSAGCAALPPKLDPMGGGESVAMGRPLPARGEILLFRISASETKARPRKVLLNPRRIDRRTGGGGYWHVALSLGGGAMIHAWDEVKTDRCDAYGRFDSFPIGASPEQVEKIVRRLYGRLGEKYDLWEAASGGALDKTNRPICTSLLVEAFRGVEDDGNGLTRLLRFIEKNQNRHGFVSANQLARYFKARDAEVTEVASR